jgi:Methyltransferase domain
MMGTDSDGSVSVVVNLGGEGEIPGAINVNAFIEPQMFRPKFPASIPAELVLRKSAHDTGLEPASADVVVANRFPIQYDQFVIDPSGRRADVADLAAEIVRILKPGGRLHFGCATCDRASLSTSLLEAGLVDVQVGPGGYIDARKP